jgi:uncharacterized RmlC-like cupin family protein
MRQILRTLLTLVPMIPSASAHAQSRTSPVVRIEASAIDSAFRSIAATPAEFARELAAGDKAKYQFIVLSRSTTGPAELHDDWTDVIFVRSGSANLRTGLTLVERKPADKGEWRGTAISDARDEAAHAGDVLIIPAGIAHQWQPEQGSPFSYVILKVRLARQRPNTR